MLKIVGRNTPEKKIKELLDETQPSIKNIRYLDEYKKTMIIGKTKSIQFFLDKGDQKALGLNSGDVIDISIKVLLRRTY